jgi:hypothetical protein
MGVHAQHDFHEPAQPEPCFACVAFLVRSFVEAKLRSPLIFTVPSSRIVLLHDQLKLHYRFKGFQTKEKVGASLSRR